MWLWCLDKARQQGPISYLLEWGCWLKQQGGNYGLMEWDLAYHLNLPSILIYGDSKYTIDGISGS